MKSIFTSVQMVHSTLMAVVLFLSATSSANAFTLRDDPSSGFGGGPGTIPSIVDPDFSSNLTNIYSVSGFIAENFTSNDIQSLYFSIPYSWVRIGPNTRVALDWDNGLAGWHTDDFDGTSLTVRLSSAAVDGQPAAIDFVAMGELADPSGNQQLELSVGCSPLDPTCDYPIQTLVTTDTVPLFSLGAFGPNQQKTFDIAFTYEFGDNRTEAWRTGLHLIAHP